MGEHVISSMFGSYQHYITLTYAHLPNMCGFSRSNYHFKKILQLDVIFQLDLILEIVI